jgi:hypothetical protein
MFEKIKNIFKKEKEYPLIKESIKENDIKHQLETNPILKECPLCHQKSASSYWTLEDGVQVWRYGFCGHRTGRNIPL